MQDLGAFFAAAPDLDLLTRSVGKKRLCAAYLEDTLGLPLHLRVVIQALAAERGGALEAGALDAIPFYSLCRGLFLPLEGIWPQRADQLFGIKTDPPPDAAARERLLFDFLKKPTGLGLEQKLACILGDPFFGDRATLRRDSLLRLLLSMQLCTRRELLDRLARAGDIAVLFAESRPRPKEEPPLTALEVTEALRLLPSLGRTEKLELLRSLLGRSGKLEAFFIARLVLRKAGLGFEHQGELLSRLLAGHFDVPQEQVAHAMALTDPFKVARALAEQGAEGLRRIRLSPLVPVRPALAGGTTDEIRRYPVWVECKYDGIRLMLHRSTDERGGVLCAGYTRGRRDWLELVPGLELTLRMVPARQCIIDGELFGTLLDIEGVRPASVYEVYAALQGSGSGVSLRYAAFDLLYLEGQDLTGLPLTERRRRLAAVLAPLAPLSLPLPLGLVPGQLARDKEDVNRLYQHFRARGHEGVIAKDPDGPYLLAARDPGWTKRKPLLTLDLVLLGAVQAVTAKEHAGMFGSYVIGARREDGGFEDVGDVAGVDRARELQIQQEIMREGLLTGRRIERQSASGVRPGFELRPGVVVTVKLEGITRDMTSGRLGLRDPKLLQIRSDKAPQEADGVQEIEKLYLRQRVG